MRNYAYAAQGNSNGNYGRVRAYGLLVRHRSHMSKQSQGELGFYHVTKR